MPRNTGQGSTEWHGKFRGCGFRMTLGRGAILDILTKEKKHLSAEDIYLKVHPKCPSVGLTTVYRTLEVLVNMGWVSRLDFGDRRARYELSHGEEQKGHHHHLVCRQCKRVIDYDDFMEDEVVFLKKVEKGLSKKYNFDIQEHMIQFYGICSTCQKK